MPYNEKLDERIADEIQDWGLVRKKMFGGTCYLLNGNMMCGVYKDYLIIRLGNEEGIKALQEPFVHVFDITGRPMKGWVMVEEKGFQDDHLRRWLEKSINFVKTLPEK